MMKFEPGDRAVVVEMPPHGQHLVGQLGTVARKGGLFDEEPDPAVPFKLDSGSFIDVRASQLRRA